MGREVLEALRHDPDLDAVGAVDVKADDPLLWLPDGSGEIPFSAEVEDIIGKCQPDVMVDFTIADAAMAAARVAAKRGVNLVVGTTGLSPSEYRDSRRAT